MQVDSIVFMDTQKRGDHDHEPTAAEPHEEEALAYAQAFSARVRELRGKKSRQQLAQELGIHPNTLGKFERGESMPDAYLIHRMCRVAQRSPQWLIEGDGPDAPAGFAIPAKSVTAVESAGFVWVPLFDIQVSAGNGAFTHLERVVAMRPFDRNFIRGELGIPHNDLAMCQIIGDSAWPRLSSKDSVLLDRRDNDVSTEGMHIVRLDGALLAKRLQRLPGRTLRVSSQNEEYSPFDIGPDEPERDFAVLGRIRWGGVSFQ